MLTTAEANTLGWTLAADGEDGYAFKGDAASPQSEVHVASVTPLFALLVNIAETEGRGFAAGYGGDQTVTAELVAACSGETYDDAEAQAAAAAAESEATASAWVELRKIRDRWVNECQYVFDRADGVSQRVPSTAAEIDAHAAEWQQWRQQMLDLPQTIGADNDPRPALSAIVQARIGATSDAFPAPWPQPPSAPVVHLT